MISHLVEFIDVAVLVPGGNPICHKSPSHPQDDHFAAGVMSVGFGPFTETSEEFAPYYLAGIRHDLRQTTLPTTLTSPSVNFCQAPKELEPTS